MSDSAEARRIRAVLTMYEFGVQMYRTKLGREFPDASGPELDARVNAWRLDRPGEMLGEAVGRPSDRFA